MVKEAASKGRWKLWRRAKPGAEEAAAERVIQGLMDRAKKAKVAAIQRRVVTGLAQRADAALRAEAALRAQRKKPVRKGP